MKVGLIVLFFNVAYVHGIIIPMARLENIANYVNSMKTTWTAGMNFDTNLRQVDLRNTIGARIPEKHKPAKDTDDDSSGSEEKKANNCEDNGLPKTFDARQKWPKCISIGHIYDQGNCGSCWAVSPTSAFTDRICIASQGRVNSFRSIQQPLSCCHKCAVPEACNGGWPDRAWEYFKRNGLVTGGDYNSKQGCQPYRIKPCSHHVNSTLPLCSSTPNEKAHKCKLHCYNGDYNKKYKTDLYKAQSVYEVDPCSAMNEIYNHGPIVASFNVFEDFYTYKSGVYQYITGKSVGWHAVRVIGWGEENNLAYWLVTNSWNENWGDKGYFKILRGENNCWFEESFTAGLPKL